MHNNESIHLWLLEEDRRKRRMSFSEEHDQNPGNKYQTRAYHPSFDRETITESRNKQQSFLADLHQLLRKKDDLELGSQRLDDQHRILDARAKFLCRKIIQEIKKQNREKEQSVCNLKERIAGMETQLGPAQVFNNLGVPSSSFGQNVREVFISNKEES